MTPVSGSWPRRGRKPSTCATEGREAVEREREQALLEVRRSVVDLALLAASQAVVQNLDDRAHRQAVEEFVSSLERQA